MRERGGPRATAQQVLVGRVTSANAAPASETLRQRTCCAQTALRAGVVVGSQIEASLRQVRRLAAAAGSNALLLLMPVPMHAAGPSDLADLGAGQVMEAPAKGIRGTVPDGFPMEEFLDQLMAAESGGRLNSKNPRSTALGPFQFIQSTFLHVVSKHFPAEVAGRTEQKVLALRSNLAFSRRAARAYANDLISALNEHGLEATTVNVRIAFLVGPYAAVRLLKAPPDQPLKAVLSVEAIAANPFMSGATVAMLVRRAAADVRATAAEPDSALAASQSEPEVGAPVVASQGAPIAAVIWQGESASAPGAAKVEPTTVTGIGPVQIKCEIGLASCRRWIVLQEQKARQLDVNSGP